MPNIDPMFANLVKCKFYANWNCEARDAFTQDKFLWSNMSTNYTTSGFNASVNGSRINDKENFNANHVVLT